MDNPGKPTVRGLIGKQPSPDLGWVNSRSPTTAISQRERSRRTEFLSAKETLHLANYIIFSTKTAYEYNDRRTA